MDKGDSGVARKTWLERYGLLVAIGAALLVAFVLFQGWVAGAYAENCEPGSNGPWQCDWFWQEAASEAALLLLAFAGVLTVFGIVRALWRIAVG